MAETTDSAREGGALGVLLWLPIGSFILVSVLMFRLAGFSGGHTGALTLQLGLGVLVTYHLGSRPGTARFGRIVGSVYLVTLFLSASLLLTHAAATLARPLVDAQLLAADRWMGYDWRTLIGYFARHPAIAMACIVAYNTHFLQPYVLAVVLVITGHFARFEKMVLVFLLAMIVTTVMFALWPVGTPWGHEGLSAAQLAPYRFPQPRTVGWEADLLRLRGGLRVIPASFQAGLVSFPSFHCISALVFVWAAWPVRWLRWLLLPINAMMIVAALFVGCHYLIDIVAGAAITAASVAIVNAAYPRLIKRAASVRGARQPAMAAGPGALAGA